MIEKKENHSLMVNTDKHNLDEKLVLMSSIISKIQNCMEETPPEAVGRK